MWLFWWLGPLVVSRAYSDSERETEALRACVLSGREPGVLLGGGGAIPIM